MQERAAEILQEMKEQLAEIVSRAKYELLIRPLRPVSFENSTLTLSTSNEALRGWLLDKYGDVLAELANLASGENVRLAIEVAVGVSAGESSQREDVSRSGLAPGQPVERDGDVGG